MNISVKAAFWDVAVPKSNYEKLIEIKISVQKYWIPETCDET
jgi:hypothetical protein